MTEQSHSPTGDDELRHKFAAFVSHATGGRTSDISLPLNTLSVMASQKVNDAWQAALEKGRAESHVAHSPIEATGDDVECVTCGLPPEQHYGPEKFCRCYPTYRSRAAIATQPDTDRERG